MVSPAENNYVSSISELINFANQYTQQHSRFSKNEVAIAVQNHFALSKSRSVYHNNYFSIRFSTASGLSFSNTVLGLSTLQRYDHAPFIVCIVRPNDIQLLLANSTFLRKVSHSSQQLRIDNIRGSFLGHDILREYEGIENIPENFEKLFLIHKEFTWEDNLLRLVEATNNIAPTGRRYTPTEQEVNNILASADIAHTLLRNSDYLSLGESLSQTVEVNKAAILEAGKIDDHKSRGDQIEEIVTNSTALHGAEDFSYTLDIGSRVLVDIKTKVLTLNSSPKGYNIDKLLENLGVGKTIFCFFFIGLNLEDEMLSTRLISVLDDSILGATRIQFHWAGRNSRGVTQLTGNFSNIFSSNYVETIDTTRAKDFLGNLIQL